MQHFGKETMKTTIKLSSGQEVEIKQIRNAQLMMRAKRAYTRISILWPVDFVLEHIDPQRVEAFVVPLEQAAQALENIARKPI